MSIFGIVYVIAKAGSNLVVNIRNNAIDRYNKKHNVHLDGKTYVGHDGIPRIIGSGKKGTYSRNVANDWVLYDEDHKEVYNFTRTQNSANSLARKRTATEKGKTVYEGYNDFGDSRLRDVETNHIVYKVVINDTEYYWDNDAWCILRMTDDEIKKRKDSNYPNKFLSDYEDLDIPRFNQLWKEFNEKNIHNDMCFPGQDLITTCVNKFFGVNSKEPLCFYINYDPFIIASSCSFSPRASYREEGYRNDYKYSPQQVAKSLLKK